jgi:sec-independent protein translocase protein TatA
MTGWTSPSHLAIILLIALLVFGAKKLPEIGRSLGHGMREFKDSVGGKEPPQQQQLPAPPAETTPEPPVVVGSTAEHENE